MATSVLIVPGYNNSGPEHWQSLWERAHPEYRRVMQRDWDEPVRDEWVGALDDAIAQAPHPVVLVAHSLGCLAVVHWAAQHQRAIQGALLVAPPDAEDPDFAVDDGGFAPVPLAALPFPSIVVASTDDPYISMERAEYFASAWGSLCISAGPSGHINTDAGFGPWPFGEELLAELCQVAERPPMTEEQLRAAQVGELKPLAGPIQIVDYDPQWPRLFEREAVRVRAALGERVLVLEHVGSTSVPGLAAKPKIDMLLVVADSADESAYVPALVMAGYVLQIREPDWYKHRMFKGPDTDINLHVFSPGCPEIERMLGFRDWLRSHADDRRLYEQTKRELARKDWKYMQNYADAKTAVVEKILARAL